jgi:hypothetical protein
LPSYLITALTVACALFMENLDSTVIATSVPAIASDLNEATQRSPQNSERAIVPAGPMIAPSLIPRFRL